MSRRDSLGVTAAALVAAACIALSMSSRIDDPRLWQHLLVGKAIALGRSIPAIHMWSWPTYGAREALPSWGFRVLLWPIWSWGGVSGLYVWRWLTTLAAFGILAAVARTMGARGISSLVVFVLCSLVYGLGHTVGPETVVAVLLALELWILETRRRMVGRDPKPWLIAIIGAWANVDVSFGLGIVLIGIHVLDARFRAWRARIAWPPVGSRRAVRMRSAAAELPREATIEHTRLAAGAAQPGAAGVSRPTVADYRAAARRLGLVALGCIAVSFVNPFGWHALLQAFEFLTGWRNEPILKIVPDLHPVPWSLSWRSGLPLLIMGWPVLGLWRARRVRFDLAEILTCALFTSLALSARRFTSIYAVVAAPYVARDLDAWFAHRSWKLGHLPVRAALTSMLCILVSLPTWIRIHPLLDFGLETRRDPLKACDFIRAQGIMGRGFTPHLMGGYVLWRSWPDRERLPFMDADLGGTREIRRLYPLAFTSPSAWKELDDRYHFDYVLHDGRQPFVGKDRLLDFLDADSTWGLVFRDDAAALYVRRERTFQSIANRFGYLFVPGGEERLVTLGRACQADSVVRGWTRRELARQIAESNQNARARSLLASIALLDGRRDEARSQLAAALDTDPKTSGAHRRLGMIALTEGRPEEALREFEHERVLGPQSSELDALMAQAYHRLGDSRRAAAWYRRAIERDPGNAAARESLRAISK